MPEQTVLPQDSTPPPVPRPGEHECPVCPGLVLDAHVLSVDAEPSTAEPPRLERCRRCRGLLVDPDDLGQLHNVSPRRLLSSLRPPSFDVPRPCPDCGTPVRRDAAECTVCGQDNLLDCPRCERPMEISLHRAPEADPAVDAEHRIDRCKGCGAVWLDAHELRLIWAGLGATLGITAVAAASQAAAAEGAGWTVAEAAGAGADLLGAVDPWLLEAGVQTAVHVVPQGVQAVGHAAAATPELIGGLAGGITEGAADLLTSAPSAAGSLLEGTGALASAVVEGIADLLSALA